MRVQNPPSFAGMYRVTGTLHDFLHLGIEVNEKINPHAPDKITAEKNFCQISLAEKGDYETRLYCTKEDAVKLYNYNKNLEKNVVSEWELVNSKLDMIQNPANSNKYLDYCLAIKSYFEKNFRKYLPNYDKTPEYKAADVREAMKKDAFDPINGIMMYLN